MKFLSNSLLIRLVEPLEIRLKKKRGAPKICLVDHGLRASWLQEVILAPSQLAQSPHLSDLADELPKASPVQPYQVSADSISLTSGAHART